jgi:hypothetical protein
MLADYDAYFRDSAPGATLFRKSRALLRHFYLRCVRHRRCAEGCAAMGVMRAETCGVSRLSGRDSTLRTNRKATTSIRCRRIQPFAVIESLARHGLASPRDFQVVTYDVNPRVNDHIDAARQRAAAASATPSSCRATRRSDGSVTFSVIGRAPAKEIGRAVPPSHRRHRLAGLGLSVRFAPP